MKDLEQIQGAIKRLTSRERASLGAWLSQGWSEIVDFVAEPAAAYKHASEAPQLSAEEYLAFEATSHLKHEYVGGRIFAMSGVTYRHNVITDNLVGIFNAHLRGGPCRALSSGVKVRMSIKRDEIFYYPDVIVNCEQLNGEQSFLRHPKLIIEVLSPSTEMIDRREKALHYRQINSLEEYVLVAQHQREVTILRRRENWQAQVLGSADAVAEFRSIDLPVSLSRIYEGVS